MATLWTSDLGTTDVASSGDFHSNQVMRQPASTHNKSIESDRVWAGPRVLRVLVVNGEQDSANALVRQVRYGGHAANVALETFDTLPVAAAQHPDVVLLDMEMSPIGGCHVARRLRSRHLSDDSLIIAITEWADDARRKQSMDAGIDLLLIKPVDPEVVETLLMLECVRVNRRPA